MDTNFRKNYFKKILFISGHHEVQLPDGQIQNVEFSGWVERVVNEKNQPNQPGQQNQTDQQNQPGQNQQGQKNQQNKDQPQIQGNNILLWLLLKLS